MVWGREQGGHGQPRLLRGYVQCAGPSPWYLTANVAMRNAKDVLTAHSEAVTITVNVTP